jgi:4-hydroxybenzoate polyprenyltransferase
MWGPLEQIGQHTRQKQWRTSLLPFLAGSAYLTLLWHGIAADSKQLLVVFLYALSSVGFAMTGYLINEWSDVNQDRRSGKANRLSGIPIGTRASLLTVALAVALLPWSALPSDRLSWLLIASELTLLGLYSFPWPRLKSVPLISNLVDAAYAYTVPVWLTVHTFSITAGAEMPTWLPALLAAVTFTGIRNILIHQCDDMLHDRKAGMTTLPQLLGIRVTGIAIASVRLVELTLNLLVSFIVFNHWPVVGIVMALGWSSLTLFVLLRAQALSVGRHSIDHFGQIVLPLFFLGTLVWSCPLWAVLVPVHLIALVPPYVYQESAIRFRRHVPPMVNRIRVMAGRAVNIMIYILFRLFGVDLRKEQTDALGYLRGKFKG